MSIFKSTLKPYVVRQINTRQNLLSEVKRPVEFAHYVSSKSPWIRMTSFVNYGPKGNETEDLAKKYILMGGALYNMKSGGYSQRSGVGGAGSVYGGDLGTNQYGIRPMPGIAELNTRSLGAYGSLTEATVKFYAWDVKQLEDLTVLFMRPGYKVLLEWGWSMYLDTSISGEDYKKKSDPNSLKGSFTNYSIQNMPFNTIDCFNPGITQDGIYDQLDKIRHRYSGNYDGVLGSIKNYQYTLLPNGAYECTVTLISIGDVIDTIRLNDTLGYEASEGGEAETATTGSTTPDIKSDFEIIFDEYARIGPFKDRTTSPIITSIDSRIQPKDAKYIDPYVYTYQLPEEFVQQQIIPQGMFKQGGKRSYYYLQFGYILHILNSLKNVFVSKNQTLFEIEIPSDPNNPNSLSNGLCQASYNVVSIDPSVCIIRNINATLFTSKEKDSSNNIIEVKGFRPNIYKNENFIVEQASADLISNNKNIKEYLYSTTNFGLISNIYVNILEVISIYKEQSISNNGYVYLGEFISALLSKISYSLGSINDFDKFVSNNKVVIIDKHYTEVGADSAYNNKFKINIAGNNSIVRSHKVESKIFPSQATMIAIAAQSRENISALQTSTYNYINEGLVDRLLGDKTNKKEDQGGDNKNGQAEENAKVVKLNSILKLIQYVNNYVIPNNINSDSYASNVSTMNGYLNTLLVEMEGGTNYKAVIPISVNLTVDGLSGLTIGEIFTVDKKVLPRDHKDKSIGFIITKLASQIIGGSWTTNIESQMCVLDQESKQIITKQKAEELLRQLLEQSKKNVADTLRSIAYYKILAALYIDVLRENIIVKNVDGELEFKKDKYGNPRVLYSKTAVQEVGGSGITYGDLITEFTNTYKRLYPKTTTTNINEITYINDEGKKVTEQKINISETRESGIHKNGILENIIQNMSYYTEMSDNSVKNVFYSEMNKVRQGYEKDATPPDYTRVFDAGFKVLDYLALLIKNPLSAGNLGGQAKLAATYSTTYVIAIANTTFNLINAEKSVDKTTGEYIVSVPLITGYAYFSDKQ
jgi:hypothetical protein